jgi:dihydroorotase
MPKLTLIKNAQLVNEGRVHNADVLIKGQRIEKIAPEIQAPAEAEVVEAAGKYLLPGMIDDQVHFRDPGLTHKGDFATESAAAVAGGITSVMDMPNTSPLTINQAAIEDKHAHVAGRSHCNYGFYLGATNDNIEAIKSIDPTLICGIKVFMGASTGNMLVDDEQTLTAIFKEAPTLIATHCEDTPTILANEEKARLIWGENVPMAEHPNIRSREACIKSTRLATGLARKYRARLHVLHISTAEEVAMFQDLPTEQKHITAEACVHFTWFDENDYADKGALIKCNPAIKTAADRAAIIEGIKSNRLDVIATDHAPHTREEKAKPYFGAPSGLPLVQTALPSLLTQVNQGRFSLTDIVRKTAHTVADIFQVIDRGYLREGYFADLVLVDMNAIAPVKNEDMLYKCGWTPYAGSTFTARIEKTWVNGTLKWDGAKRLGTASGQPLAYRR